jgi:chemotaxis signal transduction protein
MTSAMLGPQYGDIAGESFDSNDVNAAASQPAFQFADAQNVRESARKRSGTVDLLIFRVGRERFGVGLAAVDEVVAYPDVKPMPQSPESMLGMAHLRETLLPVHTPGPALGLALSAPRAVVVAKGRKGRKIGIAVDEAEGVTAFDFDGLTTTHASGIVLGVSTRGSLLAVVDIEALVESL